MKEAKDRLERYEKYRKYMEENGLSQISITDPEARLMKSKNGFMVAYNVQTAVDLETHLIKDFQVANQPTDQGLWASTLSGIKAEKPEEEEEVSDKCLEEMKERALEGYFVRDPERNLVYCPGGEILRQKSIKKNGNIRYANKTACRRCPNRNKCYKGKNEWKEIDFPKEVTEKPCKTWMEEEGEGNENTQGKKKKKGRSGGGNERQIQPCGVF